MDTFKFRMTGTCPAKEKPPLGFLYDFAYISDNDFAEYIGNETTGCFYILENGKIVGSNKTGRVKVPSSPVILHLGKLKVTKLNLWTSGGGEYYYAIVGVPELFDIPRIDGEVVEACLRLVQDYKDKNRK